MELGGATVDGRRASRAAPGPAARPLTGRGGRPPERAFGTRPTAHPSRGGPLRAVAPADAEVTNVRNRFSSATRGRARAPGRRASLGATGPGGGFAGARHPRPRPPERRGKPAVTAPGGPGSTVAPDRSTDRGETG
ncbi:hypothetical protein GCM10017667_62500 [Streptomyces filamentosus]|uniref:Uncharacterized protein n=1 Tax=Streptomyces filamentosus TaxID=67294 RepID=A0A919BWE1_STRFL|nr:hypothetical protein GCM10017667_62500 [Streptomyces filamentosus]